MNSPSVSDSPLDRARKKAYWRLLPLLFVCYVIAYVDRVNVSIAKLTMINDLPAFDNAVIGFGAGIFFWGYFLLEVPGSLIVEKWSARKWICRIMVTWGVMAAMTAFVHYRIPGFTQVAEVMMAGIVAMLKPLAQLSFEWMGMFSWLLDWLPSTSARLLAQFQSPAGLSIFQFYSVRFLLGLAEAGFFPGIVVFLTHWFPQRDRTRALAFFFVGTPVAQIISPPVSNALLRIDQAGGAKEMFGLTGWQWVYVFWGIPAVVLGLLVLFLLKDRPKHAHWLTPEERDALEKQLEADKAAGGKKRMTLFQALRHPMVLLLSLAYFCNVTANYGSEFFLPSIIKQWYNLKISDITWLVMLPPVIALAAQLFVGWNSDRVHERRWHAVVPLLIAAGAIALAPYSQGTLWLTIACFMLVFGGLKGYLPAFWAMPSMFLTGPAAAGSIGLINSLGNLGGFFGPNLLGTWQKDTGSYSTGLFVLAGSITISATILFFLGLGRRDTTAVSAKPSEPTTLPASTKTA